MSETETTGLTMTWSKQADLALRSAASKGKENCPNGSA